MRLLWAFPLFIFCAAPDRLPYGGLTNLGRQFNLPPLIKAKNLGVCPVSEGPMLFPAWHLASLIIYLNYDETANIGDSAETEHHYACVSSGFPIHASIKRVYATF